MRLGMAADELRYSTPKPSLHSSQWLELRATSQSDGMNVTVYSKSEYFTHTEIKKYTTCETWHVTCMYFQIEDATSHQSMITTVLVGHLSSLLNCSTFCPYYLLFLSQSTLSSIENRTLDLRPQPSLKPEI